MGPPHTTTWEYPVPDNSWDFEMAEFLQDIRTGRDPVPGLAEAIAALGIVARIYERSARDYRA